MSKVEASVGNTNLHVARIVIRAILCADNDATLTDSAVLLAVREAFHGGSLIHRNVSDRLTAKYGEATLIDLIREERENVADWLVVARHIPGARRVVVTSVDWTLTTFLRTPGRVQTEKRP